MTTPEYIYECIVQYVLFNNPEQAENLKEQLLCIKNCSESLNFSHRHGVARRLWVVRLSDQAYTVDALAVRGDEGRANLRKAPVR